MWNQVNCTKNHYANVGTSSPYKQWSYPMVSCPHQKGLGFRVGGETVRLVRLENGDGGGDDDSLRFYVAITIPQIPLSKIDCVVNQFSTRRAKVREI